MGGEAPGFCSGRSGVEARSVADVVDRRERHGDPSGNVSWQPLVACYQQFGDFSSHRRGRCYTIRGARPGEFMDRRQHFVAQAGAVAAVCAAIPIDARTQAFTTAAAERSSVVEPVPIDAARVGSETIRRSRRHGGDRKEVPARAGFIEIVTRTFSDDGLARRGDARAACRCGRWAIGGGLDGAFERAGRRARHQCGIGKAGAAHAHSLLVSGPRNSCEEIRSRHGRWSSQY